MLDKTYSPAAIEERLYDGWEKSGAFSARPHAHAAPFTVMIPPPNVTGSLHMGHALTFTLQDALIRFRRMQGRDALWQPGTDHAGIATQMVVERLLAAEGTTRQALGREAFLERVWRWKAESGGTITHQLRRLGASLDWPRERFTMDEGLSRAVREVFVRLHGEKLIYRARRLVNWDPRLQTAISDLEVESREIKGELVHIRYPIAGAPGQYIVVATTRPETMLGDTAVAVHPDDARYRHLIGGQAILPLVGRAIPIIADEISDPEKGTGAVKITPAHDFNDFAAGTRHKLPMPSVLDRVGAVSLAEIAGEMRDIPGLAGADFVRTLEGQDRFAARAAITAELDRLGLLDKIEPHVHQVPHGDRSGVPIEPRLTLQWFCDAATLAGPAIAAVEAGRTDFVPKQWENTFFAWLRDIEPWCISRQLWWGHRIPAWYGPDGQIFVARDAAEAAAHAHRFYGHEVALTQDEDVLDTWFSSALWPFSTLGWPERTADLARHYPGDVLVTGFDIIFFWVARMLMMGLHFMGEVPFRDVYIHGLVRDERGQKMSKSKGNVIDPLALIDSYGADALRFTVCALAGPGRDVKFGAGRVEGYRSFVTKLWNAARFCEMNRALPQAGFDPAVVRTPLCRWLLDEANTAVTEATAALEAFRFDEYANACYRFVWNVFCDWFLELAKPALAGGSAEALETRAVAAHVLGLALRLLHPSAPFVTEELWQQLGYDSGSMLIRAPWPQPAAVAGATAARVEIGYLIELISKVRSTIAELKLAPNVKRSLHYDPARLDPTRKQWLAQFQGSIDRLANVTLAARVFPGITAEDKAYTAAVVAVAASSTIQLVVAGDDFGIEMQQIDTEAEHARLARERTRAAEEAEKIARKLANADFIARAPAAVVAENRERLSAAQAEIARLEAAIGRIA